MGKVIGKPTVQYKGEPVFYSVQLTPSQLETYGVYADEDGFVEYARVYGLDHPIFGEDNLRTSVVLVKHDDGSFETMNTIYRPTNDD
jgi:hypothetical protein